MTGASSGSAGRRRSPAERGARVMAVARNEARLAELANMRASRPSLSLDTRRGLRAAIEETHRRLGPVAYW